MSKKNIRCRVISILCFLSCLSLSTVIQAQLSEPTRQHQQIQTGETPEGLTRNEWGDIQKQINSAKYRAHAYAKGGYHTANLAHGWQIQYAVDGTTTLTPQNNKVKPYQLGMKLSAIGYQTLHALHKPQKISQHDFTVSYQWNDNLRERWINSEQQLEQWFDIARRPEGADKGLPLTVQLTLDSELKATQNGNSIQFTDSMGTDITYNKLKVWDSTGRELSSRMQLASNTLSLLVDDNTAQYPLTIDPSFQQLSYVKASNTNAGDWFGWSIAISDNSLVIGASGAAYVFIRSGSTWVQQAYLKGSNTDVGDAFGVSVAISGDTLVVGASAEDSYSTGVNGDQSDNSANASGAAYVFIRNGETWTQQAYLKASNTDSFDLFGYSVAISSDTLVVGAFQEGSSSVGVNGDQSDNLTSFSGAAYVFTRSGSTWTQQAYLKASNPGVYDQFGFSVAISGETLVVGARFEKSNSIGVNGDQSDNSLTEAGAGYVFIRNGITWTQQAYLKASNNTSFDWFGTSVAISGDTLVIGAENESYGGTGVNGDQRDGSATDSGAAYVFIRTGLTWAQQAYIKASNTEHDEWFGESVAISGNMLVVGAQNEDSYSTGVDGDDSDNSAINSGAAYVFTRNGSTWTQLAYLKASNTDAGDRFGYSVAISGDTVVVGAAFEDSNSTGINGDQSDNSAVNAGASYVFEMTDVTPSVETLSIPIEMGSDDAEENLNDGDVSLFSSDLELTQDGLKPQKVGLRFPLNIPAEAKILNASIQFTADETSSDATVLSIAGQATVHAMTFTNDSFDISNRPLTKATIPWTPPAWIVKGEAGPHQATPDISVILQEIVDQDDWAQGHSVAIIISGDGMREAESFDGTAPPVLQVTYSTIPPALAVPVAVDDNPAIGAAYTADVNQQLIVPNGANDLVERNDNVGFPVAEISSFGPNTGTEYVAGNLGKSAVGGDLIVNPDGSFSYTSPPNFMAVDRFVYMLENSEGSDSAAVYIRVEPALDLTNLWVPVIIGSDDAEENIADGNMTLKSSDLELVKDGVNPQQVGVRFQDLAIPQGATIIEAYIQYTSDETSTQLTEVTMYGQSSANALTFLSTPFDISTRPLTSAAVEWVLPVWNTVGTAGSDQKTPNLSAIVQEVVDQQDWAEGNPIVFITKGSGKRVAESFEGTAPPVLHVSFSIEPPVVHRMLAINDGTSTDPAYITGVNQQLIVPNGPDDLVERNDIVGFPVAEVVYSEDRGQEGGAVIINPDGSFNYTPAENFVGVDTITYVLRNSEDDSSLGEAFIGVIDIEETIALSIPVIIGSDDAEQDVSDGDMYLGSSDLEMIMDKAEMSIQQVGIRFQGIAVPPGAMIKKAYIQYTTDEVSIDQTILNVYGEASADALTFEDIGFNISERTVTTAQIEWTPPPWNIRGAAGPEQATPDLAAIVQEIVGQDGWAERNSMVFIISGNGNRVAESFDGTAAPVLHLEYSSPSTGNAVPIATEVSTTNSSGDPLFVGHQLTGTYVFNDAEGDLEGASTFRWLRDGVEIINAIEQNYTTVEADTGNTLSFEVTPVAMDGSSPGIATSSEGVMVNFQAYGIGPAGGIIIYVIEANGAVVLSGIEAAPVDHGSRVPWGCAGTFLSEDGVRTGADGFGIGTGVENTMNILAACNEPGIAARIAEQYVLNGFDDWFLPSYGTLQLLYNLWLNDPRDLSDAGFYWSSSESGTYSGEAWSIGFNEVGGESSPKSYRNKVRVVRIFSVGDR